jgi:type IV fimbrial biogenesis protein FimT
MAYLPISSRLPLPARWQGRGVFARVTAGSAIALPARGRQAGFTFIEMMMVIVIVAILAAVGAPSMVDMIRTSKVRTAASDFYAALLQARSEAIKRRTTITMAPVGATWLTGWTVTYGTSPVVTVAQADPLSDVAVQVGVPSAATASITFGTNGRVTSTAPTVIFYSSLSTSVQARCVSVDAAGLPRVRTDTNSVATDGCN